MQLCFLGTASGLPEQDRFSQTVVISFEDEDGVLGHYILDVGDGASSLFARNGFDHREIRAIMISHMHGDHHGGFLQLVKTCMHYDRTEELVVLAPAEGIQPLKAYLEASYLYDPLLGFPIRWIPLNDVVGREIELPGDIRFEAFANSHLDSARRKLAQHSALQHNRTFESYSMALRDATTRVVYSGNLNGPNGADELAGFVEPCDVFLCEVAHVDPTLLGRFVAGKHIGTVAMAHFHPKWNGTPDEEIVTLVKNAGAECQVLAMRDGECVATSSSSNLVKTRQLTPHIFK
ncbi:MAG: MBL fold metallo-hydrolase [Thermomicrobiales bacterium]|nr:MBL fold metallo-hydrolase [Thermomicrobiales bacterium]